jgi:hypothetical protein
MKKVLVCLTAVACLALPARRARAAVPVQGVDQKHDAMYASGQAGLQTKGSDNSQAGVEIGAHLYIFDGYVDYMWLGSGRSTARAIVGVRGAVGTEHLRLVVRGGVGAIREQSGALSVPVGTISATRFGGVVRGGIALEARLWRFMWAGVGVDGEAYNFIGDSTLSPQNGANVLGVVKLTFEIGL